MKTMGKGYILNELRISGEGLKDSSIVFKKGLNVISGPSDTGKSFILECINYMLGSSSNPKSITELEGYEYISLEIEVINSKIYTLKRDLKGGDYEVYETNINNTENTSNIIKLDGKHNTGKENTISFFLLNLCNLNNKKLRKNERGDTIELTYRNISRLFVIDENTIIKDSSPLLSGQQIHETSEKNLFKFLITGEDDSYIKKIAGATVISNRKGKLDMLNKMIKKLGYETNYWSKEVKEDKKDELKNINYNIEELNKKHDSLNENFNKYITDKEKILDKINDYNKEIYNINLNISRVKILNEQYDSDIERLDATIESGELFSDPDHTKNKCLLCNNIVTNDCDENDIEKIIESCNSEKYKIILLKNELIESEKLLHLKKESLLTKADNENKKLVDINNNFNDEIKNNISNYKILLKGEYDKKNTLLNKIKENNELEKFISEKKVLEDFLDVNSIITFDNKFLDNENIKSFYKIVKNLLIDIKFPIDINKELNISIDDKSFDLLMNGKGRGLFGKGYRSILYSVFILSLAVYIKNIGVNIGTIVFDSPILNYKTNVSSEEKEKINNIGKNLYSYLSDYTGVEQIIVLENVEPPKHIEGKINYIKFTKNNTGRYGFLK